MADFNTLINYLKELNIENLSDSELDVLKDEIIKLLVDIQIQKDINAKINVSHTSTDDVQLEIMQKKEASIQDKPKVVEKINLSQIDKSKPDEGEKPVFSTSDKRAENNVNQSNIVENKNNLEYKKVIEESISEEIISIYSEKKEESVNENFVEEKQPDKYTESQSSVSAEKISFTINDKFRIVRKLFNNHTEQYNAFIQQLNQFQNLKEAEKFIQEFTNTNHWDEECFEYKILIKQNQKRFN